MKMWIEVSQGLRYGLMELQYMGPRPFEGLDKKFANNLSLVWYLLRALEYPKIPVAGWPTLPYLVSIKEWLLCYHALQQSEY